MNILITGGVSEFSNHLVESLLDSKTFIVLLHNGSGEKVSNLGNENLTLVNMASTDEQGIKDLINDKKIRVVYDVSLTTSAVREAPLTGAKTLLLGITAVLDAVRNAADPPSFVLVSGEEVYGNSTLRDETQPLTPVSFIGAAQMSVEAMVHSYAVSYRIPIVIGRIPTVLVTSKQDLEQKLKNFDKTAFVNILSLEQAALGVISVSVLTTFNPPADVYNISALNDYQVGNLAEMRPTQFSSAKLREAISWNPQELANLRKTHEWNLDEIPPVVLVFGDESPARNEFLELAKSQGVTTKVSSITDLQEASDADVWKEFYSAHPSHLAYFSNETDSFEGDCFTLRTNMATNLYFPWLLASIAEKTATHFTHFGDNLAREETSALAVKGFTQKMLGQFENTLRLTDKVDKGVIGLMKERKTGGLNNNV